MRFFTFREIALPTCSLFRPDLPSDGFDIETDAQYFLKRDNYLQKTSTTVER
jgi:hypothetical protein